MVRQGPVVSPLLIIGVLALATLGAATAGAEEPIDRQPYRIKVWVSVDPMTRLDVRGRARLIDEWQTLSDRFVGAPWELTIVEEPGPSPADNPEAAEAEASGLAERAEGFDKLWLIRVEPRAGGYQFTGREYDALTDRLGPIYRRTAPFRPDAARSLFVLAQDLFAPVAEIGESSQGGVAITVRGAALPAASAVGRVVGVGSVFRPLRIYQREDGSTLQINDIPWSYLRVESLDGARAHCSILSSFRDPLTRRVARRNVLVALGTKPASQPSRLRFVARPDPQAQRPGEETGEARPVSAERRPAAGFTVIATEVPDGTPREVGLTDRDGRIELRPGFANRLVILRLLAGNIEPLAEVPLMPGVTDEELTIEVNTKPLTVALQTQLFALRDEILDLVATRTRLEARMKARAEGEAWDEVQQIIAEYRRLPRPERFERRLHELRDQAQRQQTALRTPVLTRTAQAQLADLEALIERYLDDELVNAYAQAVEEAEAEAEAEAQRSDQAQANDQERTTPFVVPGRSAAPDASSTEPKQPQ